MREGAEAGSQFEDLLMFFLVAVPLVGTVTTRLFGRKLGTLVAAGVAGTVGWWMTASVLAAIGIALVTLVVGPAEKCAKDLVDATILIDVKACNGTPQPCSTDGHPGIELMARSLAYLQKKNGATTLTLSPSSHTPSFTLTF